MWLAIILRVPNLVSRIMVKEYFLKEKIFSTLVIKYVLCYIYIRKATEPLKQGEVAMIVIGEQKLNPHPHVPSETYPQASDRRYLPRWEVDNKILYRKEGDSEYRPCRSKDINCVGICIRTDETIDVNQPLSLTVYLAEGIAPVYVHGRALWRKLIGTENLVGILFDQVSDKTSERIFAYAFEYKRDELMKNWFRGLK